MTGVLRELATSIFVALPYQVADRIHPWRRRMHRETPVTCATPGERTLLIGPVNSAGQGYAWARAAERLPGVSAVDLMYRGRADRFMFPADHSVPAEVASGIRRWQDAERAAILRSFTHVIVESGARLFGTHAPVADHLRAMTDAGVEVALLFHGSDIRLPSRNAQEEKDSPFADDDAETRQLEEIARNNRALIDATGLPVFVSTPDLLAYVPEASWLPVVVDPDRWDAAAPSTALTRARPVVVHAPSRAGLKGSALIDPVVRRLHDEGVIEYREVQGIPSGDMPAVYGASDIVLDQFSLGIYGVAACEAMASGRLVISHVSDLVRGEVRERTGVELPILESTADGLEDLLRDVVARPDRYAAVAARGPAFVRDVHDGRRSAAALAPFLGVADPSAGAAGI
ncbi:hypothetical protein MIAR_15040 [Microbacterium arabinogalactanolyticum]|nr:hypothetical protein MIAR_15040 [Microbacterium arabinogalactanolyticum]